MESKEKLIDHLTKEIEVTINNMMGFRTKSAFIVWIGPYVLLSSVIIATDGDFSLTMNCAMKLALITASVSYLILGIIAGLIERGFWRRCNILRQCILELSDVGEHESKMDHLMNYEVEKLVLPGYIAVFLIIGISFGAVAYLTSGIKLNKNPISKEIQLKAVPNTHSAGQQTVFPK